MGPREHQQSIIQRRQETTHPLGRNGAVSVSAGHHSQKSRDNAHPPGGQNEVAGTSAGYHSAKRRGDAQAGTGPREHQQGVIWRIEEATHRLGMKPSREDISRESIEGWKTRRTPWVRARASAGHQSEKRMTHKLGTEMGHESISRASPSEENRQHTCWGWSGAAKT